MQVTPLGVGEAYEPGAANSAALVEAGDFRLLIDCGPTIPSVWWARQPLPDMLDAIYFTHLHLDHCLGLPTLIDQMADAGRIKPLTLIGPPAGRARLEQLVAAAAWPKSSFAAFDLDWRDSPPCTKIGPFEAAYAPTRHSVPNLAIRLAYEGRSLFYSGDGRMTAESTALMSGADLAFQECYSLEPDPQDPGHAYIELVADMAATARPGKLVLHHALARERSGIAAHLSRHMPHIELAESGRTYLV